MPIPISIHGYFKPLFGPKCNKEEEEEEKQKTKQTKQKKKKKQTHTKFKGRGDVLSPLLYLILYDATTTILAGHYDFLLSARAMVGRCNNSSSVIDGRVDCGVYVRKKKHDLPRPFPSQRIVGIDSCGFSARDLQKKIIAAVRKRKKKTMGNKVSLEENLINLRIVSKQMQRSSAKCKKNEKAATEKLKKVCVCGKRERANRQTIKNSLSLSLGRHGVYITSHIPSIYLLLLLLLSWVV